MTTPREVFNKIHDLIKKEQITKALHVFETEAWMRALSEPSEPLTNGDLSINLNLHEVSYCGKKIHLTRQEMKLLVYFVRHKGRIIQRIELIRNIYGPAYDDYEKMQQLRVNIGQLRKKLDIVPNGKRLDQDFIKSVFCIGYIMEDLSNQKERNAR